MRENQSFDPVGKGKVQILQVPADRSEAAAIVAEMMRLHALQPAADWTSFAVLTRTRSILHAIRAVCEHHGVPVRWSLDRKRMPRLHRVREIAGFLGLLAGRRDQDMSASELIELHAAKTTATADNPWSAELLRLLESWRLETADAKLPCGHVIEYIYESLAEQRRDQVIGRGVFLSTIHAAKGTEFDHVLIPGEGFRRKATRKDQEEERRLLYVGMTRARKTLSLFDRSPGTNPYLAPLDGDCLLRRSAPDHNLVPAAVLQRQYEMLGLAEMYVSFASRFSAGSPVHTAIAKLQPGDRVDLPPRDGKLHLVNRVGQCVGRLANAASDVWTSRLAGIEEVRIVALIQRDRSESKPEFRESCRCDRWEVPLVEVVRKAGD